MASTPFAVVHKPKLRGSETEGVPDLGKNCPAYNKMIDNEIEIQLILVVFQTHFFTLPSRLRSGPIIQKKRISLSLTRLERKTRLELATPTLARIAAPRSKKAPPFQTYQLSYFRRVDYQQIRGFRFIQKPIFTCMIFTRKRTGVNIGVKVQTSFAVNNS